MQVVFWFRKVEYQHTTKIGENKMTVTWKGMIYFAIGIIAFLVIGQLYSCIF